ncbi:hypothetical protein V5J35_001952 [Endozoicomonas sp. NE40]|uniref:Uncharacterized protein n=1 Tax=Endozoicomonas lisbonensis TaxID=3120522 RepID=A0ABV2SG58_9GAMM
MWVCLIRIKSSLKKLKQLAGIVYLSAPLESARFHQHNDTQPNSLTCYLTNENSHDCCRCGKQRDWH